MRNLIKRIFFLLTIINFSCSNNNIRTRRVLVDDVFAEGEISSDTVFNGLINFYDTSTNKLVLKAFYKEGIINGKRIDYYSNGKVRYIGNYFYGKEHGDLSYFDTSGNLEQRETKYFDLRVGSLIEYNNKKPSRYFFTAFDQEDLFKIHYDTIKNKLIDKINSSKFFFWTEKTIDIFEENGSKRKETEIFIYLVNPPEFNFKYSLCILNNKDSILSTVRKFKQSNIFDKFTIDKTSLLDGQRFALRLTFDRGYDKGIGEKGSMMKKL